MCAFSALHGTAAVMVTKGLAVCSAACTYANAVNLHSSLALTHAASVVCETSRGTYGVPV